MNQFDNLRHKSNSEKIIDQIKKAGTVFDSWLEKLKESYPDALVFTDVGLIMTPIDISKSLVYIANISFKDRKETLRVQMFTDNNDVKFVCGRRSKRLRRDSLSDLKIVDRFRQVMQKPPKTNLKKPWKKSLDIPEVPLGYMKTEGRHDAHQPGDQPT